MDVKQPENGAVTLKDGDNKTKSTFDSLGKLADHFSCSQCGQSLHSSEKEEHEDWHFAKTLEAEDQASTIATARPAQATLKAQQTHLKQADTNQKSRPPDYAPPSGPPPSNGTGRVVANHQHTNKVIEAARIRAKDEVRFLFGTRAHNDGIN